MNKLKTFYKNNKQKIIIGSYVVGGSIIGMLTYKLVRLSKVEDPYEGKDVISWTQTNNFINIDKVKEILDLNASNSESFAIFRDGSNSEDYTCLLISNNVVTEKL